MLKNNFNFFSINCNKHKLTETHDSLATHDDCQIFVEYKFTESEIYNFQ